MALVNGYISIARDQVLLQQRSVPGRTATVGRLPDNWLMLPDAGVARYQAELEPLAAGVLLTNLGGAAQMSLNNRPLLPYQPARLADRVRVTIGPFELVYHAQALSPDAERYTQIEPVPKRLDPPALEPVRAANLPILADGPSRYLRDLPPIYQDDDGFLGRYLKLFEAVWEPFEHRQDQIGMYFNPRTSPSELVGWLASWLGVAADPQLSDETRRRQFVAEALDLYRWRGTRYGLARAIEISLGQTPQIEDASEPWTVVVRMPEPPAGMADRAMLRRLVQAARPAHIVCRIEGEGWLA